MEQELGWALHRVMTAYRRTAVEAVTDLPGGARGYQVLVAAAEEGTPSSQLALAHRLVIDKTAVTYLVDDLERAGLVVRRPDPADRRARQVVATEAGRAALDVARRELRAVEASLLSALGPEDGEHLRHLLRRVAVSAPAAAACAATGRADVE